MVNEPISTAATSACLDLLRVPLTVSERDLLRLAVDGAVDATGSRIGYVHYVNPDQLTIELCTWSTHTRDYCTVIHDRHYPVADAGIWADTVRSGTAQLHNDYSQVPHRRGLPDGHSELIRHLGVPVLSGGAVRLVMGVGNKGTDYTPDDIVTVQAIADHAWLTTLRLREHQSVAARLSVLQDRQERTRIVTWEWDPATGRVGWDDGLPQLLGGDSAVRDSWAPLLEVLDGPSQEALGRLLAEPPLGAVELELRGRGGHGQGVTLWLDGEWVDRSQGTGKVLRGALADVSLQERFHEAAFRASHDPLTGLPNRAWLLEQLHHRVEQQRPREQFGILYIDLDRFKAINDHFGHRQGDDVLIESARRMGSVVRGGDAVARLGGDEFVMVIVGASAEADLLSLADRVIGRLAAPLPGMPGTVGASVGVAEWRPGESVDELLHRADVALYRAKRAGGGAARGGEEPPP